MSIATITAAQRVEVRDACLSAALAMQRFTQSATTPRADETAEATPVLAAAASALEVAGATGLLSTQVTLSSGVKVNAVAVTGSGNFATPTIVAGAITGIVLSVS